MYERTFTIFYKNKLAMNWQDDGFYRPQTKFGAS